HALTSCSSYITDDAAPRDLHSFPTRRSSDLGRPRCTAAAPRALRDVLQRRRERESEDAERQGRPDAAMPIHFVRHVEREPAQHRSEEHTSELQSRGHLVCRLLLEKKNKNNTT